MRVRKFNQLSPIIDALKSRPVTDCIQRSTMAARESRDCFVDSASNVLSHLKELQLGERINGGLEADVYHTNFEDYVLRLQKGEPFNPKKLKPLKDKTGLILAADERDTMRLMRYVKGKPLYGANWEIRTPISKEEYFEAFNEIKGLPDESFAEYIRNVIKIRKNGYDIDEVNPNNLLLDGKHLNIIDLERRETEPIIKIEDFNAFINYHHMFGILKNMSQEERNAFADEIKSFLDRMAEISKKEGYPIQIPELNHNKLQEITTYLYHKDWDIINAMVSPK